MARTSLAGRSVLAGMVGLFVVAAIAAGIVVYRRGTTAVERHFTVPDDAASDRRPQAGVSGAVTLVWPDDAGRTPIVVIKRPPAGDLPEALLVAVLGNGVVVVKREFDALDLRYARLHVERPLVARLLAALLGVEGTPGPARPAEMRWIGRPPADWRWTCDRDVVHGIITSFINGPEVRDWIPERIELRLASTAAAPGSGWPLATPSLADLVRHGSAISETRDANAVIVRRFPAPLVVERDGRHFRIEAVALP